jgi:hypothetical protein
MAIEKGVEKSGNFLIRRILAVGSGGTGEQMLQEK